MKIGITIGDPCGIGEEVVLKSLTELKGSRNFGVVLYGFDPSLIDSCDFGDGIEVVSIQLEKKWTKGNYDPSSAVLQIDAIKASLNDIKNGNIHSIVTSPINKRAIKDYGLSFPGQTEFLAHETDSNNFAMVLTGSKLTVLTITTHVPIKEVAILLRVADIVNKTKILHDFLKFKRGIENPHIGILGLNPHAGEGGLVGREEIEIINPAIKMLKKSGINISGPLSADSAFYRAVNGEFSALISMYHDQGLAPLKLINFENAVNITLGLPFIRTSPDHGVAYDLAGTDRASHKSMLNAIKIAAGI